MGKGDKKSKKGKIVSKSFGKCRPRKKFKLKELVHKKNSHFRKKFSKKSTFKSNKQFNIITEFSLSLTTQKGDKSYASGTAVIIAPYLAITAKHVIEDYFELHDRKSIKKKTGAFSGTFSLFAFQTLNNIKDDGVWIISRLWPCQETDLYLLMLTPYSNAAKNYKWRCPPVSFSLPKVGDRMSAFGYSESKIDNESNFLSYETSTSIGKVIEVHEKMRDSVRLNFPCFMVNSRFDGGMSGGPVFNDNGELCGLICSSLEPLSIHEPHVSYVTLLWPLLRTLIDIPYKELDKVGIYPVMKLIEYNILHAVGHENIKIID